jgi:hypothetical protein
MASQPLQEDGEKKKDSPFASEASSRSFKSDTDSRLGNPFCLPPSLYGLPASMASPVSPEGTPPIRSPQRWKGEPKQVEWQLGMYELEAEVDVTVDFFLEGHSVNKLEPGTLVEVVDVVHLPEAQRIRGKIRHPGPEGWISLEDTENGAVWAKKAEVAEPLDTILAGAVSLTCVVHTII